MRNRKRAAARLRINVISAAVASCFAADLALANPTGPAVANGQVTFHQQGNLLQITNSPNAIINWQSFSIGASEITRFLQQSASSAVLNRVITQNPSSILGALQSNGRVFLINPNGILFGPGSQIDVAGLVASTLNLSDTDFLAGRLRFTEVPGAGSVINQGAINTASGGQVYLIGPAVKNEGVITSPNGEVILAAGNSVELVNPGTPNLRVEITAPDNEAVNLGQIAADAGRVGIYAGLLNQSGTVQANTAQVTEDGRIVLKATKGVNLEAGSVTAASGVKGGQVNVETEGGTIRVAGEINASGSEAAGGAINLTVKGSGGVDLVNGLKAGNATVNVSGSGSTTTLSGNMITDGTPITIDDSVVLGNTASITLDTTGGGAFPGGADVIVTGTINDDDAGSTGLTLNSGSAGTNAVGGAIGASVPIAGLSTSGGATVLSGGVVNTIGPQTYNGPVTLGTATTLAATGAAGNIAINRSFLGLPNNLTISADGDLTITGDVASGAQTISAGGDISVAATAAGAASLFATGPQAITAGGALTVQGGSGSGLAARILGSDGQTISAMDIAVTGGSAGDSNFAEIRQTGATGSQNINAGSLTITGGSGGTNSFARIGNDGTGAQAITGSPTIVLAGGTDGAPDQGNFAQIRANGTQNLDAGSTSVTAGPSGFSNSAIIQAPHQVINISGDLIVTGGGSTGGVVHGSGARIGGLGPTQSGGGPVIPPGPTDLTLTVSGDATVIGRGAAIGSATLSGAAPASIVMMVGGDLTLDTGLGAGARIGSSSASLMPGDMVISAGTSGAGDITLNGGTGIRTLGALTISTPGNLTLTGGTGPGHSVQILSGGNQTVSAGNIALTGGAGGVNNFAEIRQLGGAADQTVTVTGGGTLSLQGGSGTDTFANIRNDGLNQWIDVPGGTIVITGGIGPDILPDPADRANNFARIENRGFGSQTVIADSIALSGGPIGQSNFAGLQGTHQQITTTGDVTLTGGGSFLGGARIGAVANLSPTDVLLNVGGNLTMTGGAGSGATIGSNPDGGQPTDIVINAAGDITLNPGPGAGTRIGSPSGNVAGGNISLTSTGGNIALNSAPGVVISIRTLDNVTLQANAITQGSESTIEADQLTTTTTAGTSLGGNNQAAGYSANNFFGGDILFNNTSPLLTVTGINQTPVGALTLIQDGDLALTGGIFSGPQSISATGNIMVAASSSTNVSASGSQTVTAGGTLTVQGAATGTNSFARLSATGDQSLTAAGISVIGGGGDGNSAEIRQLDPGSSQIITINGGGTLELQGGSGGSSNFARIRNQGISQHIDFTAGGAIVLTGGSGASDDFAHLRANSGTQLITGWPTITMTGGTGGLLDAGNQAQLRAVNGTQTVFAGDTTITAGASGFSNNVNFSAPIQAITIGGDLTMTGGGSASGAVQGGAARIGGPGGTPPSSTNLTLQVSGE
jgi:filamentous hemagglutinin family protein